MRVDTKHIAPCGHYSLYTCRLHCQRRLNCERLSVRAKMARRRAQKLLDA